MQAVKVKLIDSLVAAYLRLSSTATDETQLSAQTIANPKLQLSRMFAVVPGIELERSAFLTFEVVRPTVQRDVVHLDLHWL